MSGKIQDRELVDVSEDKKFSPQTAMCWFWSVVLFFALVWILLPASLHTGFRNDTIELSAIAQNWYIATAKHPNLPAWLLEIINILTDRSFAAPFVASQFCMVLSLWSVWQLGRTVLSENMALVGAFSILPYRFFTNESVLYNHNNALIAGWSLSMYLVMKAIQTNRAGYWIAGGIALGLTFHAKYSAIFLVIAIILFMIVVPECRKYWKTKGPYLTALAAFLVFLPHLVWLFQNDFAPLHYVSASRPHLAQWYQQIVEPFHFAGNQITYLIYLPIILCPVLGFIGRWKTKHLERNDERVCEKFLFYSFMFPLLLHMLYCGVKGCHLRMAYGAPFWIFTGVWLLLRFQTKDGIKTLFQTVRLTLAVEFVIIASWLFTFYADKQVPFCYYPMQEFGAECDRVWYARFMTPCPYVNDQYAAYAMKDKPSWTNPELLTGKDSDINEHGGMLLWEITSSSERSMPNDLHERFPSAETIPEILVLPYKTRKVRPPLTVGIAIVPPPAAGKQ
ncbi:MAG: glycosyltransferase family 39 protein [Planctomycetaceae bacterium]|jgi:hypothetical protein|nr:glycosyltransferase family 39 protein [Planctomycetaceae bacterium]